MFMEKCLLSWFLLAIFKYKLIWSAEDYNVLNRDGSYEFGYENRNSYHHSQANRNNIVRGEFGSRNPKTGAIDSTIYTAGPRGFRPRGKNIVRKYDLNQSGPRPIGSRDDPYFDPNEDPSYNFAFKTRTYDRQEAANRVGDVTGKYSYLDDVGERHNVEYIAGKRTGFHVKTPFPDSNPRAYGPLYFNGRGKPIPRGRTSIQRGLDGSYKFISAGPDQRRTETSDATGHVRGSYTYLDDKGVQHSVHYIAGPEIGYRVLKNVKGPHLPTIFPFGRPETIPKDYYDYPSIDDVFDTAASGHVKPPKGGTKPSKTDKDNKFDSDNGSDLSGNNRDKFDDDFGKPSSGGSGGSDDFDDDQSGGTDIFSGRPNNSGSGGGNSGGGNSRPGGSGSGQGNNNKPNYGSGGSSNSDYGDGDDDFDLFGNGGGSTNKPSKPNNSGNKGGGGSIDDGSYNPTGEDGSYRPGAGGSSGNSGKPSGGSGSSGTGGSGSGGTGASGSDGTGGSGSVGSGGSGSESTGGSGSGGVSGSGGGGGSGGSTGDGSDDFGLFGGSGSVSGSGSASGSGNKKPSNNAGGSGTGGGVHIGIRPIDSDNPKDDDSYDNRGTLVTNVGDKLFAVPPGVSVRAHVQAIDLLPLLPRSPSPSEQLRAEMSDQLKAESSNINEKSENETNTTTTKSNLRSKKSNLKDS